MINLQDIRYVRLGTRDLEGAVDYATKILGLQLVGREGKSAYFRSDKVAVRGDTRDHTLVYFEGDPSDHTIGFDLKDPGDFDAVGAALDNAGYGAQLANKEESEKRRARGVIQSRDPTGNKIEIVARPYHSGARYVASRDAGITHFSHIGLNSTDPVRDEQYWTKLMSARVSDWLGDAPLLRIGTCHHSIAMFPAPRPGVQHINHQVEDIDDVMKSYYFLKEKGVKIAWGPGRHPLSTAVMVYFYGPDDMVYEYSCGVKHILPDDEAHYRPRQFPPTLTSFCMWGSVPDFPAMEAAMSPAKPALKAV
ncbi:MAG TPA: VOC family protein [Stellaceae bacterium]|jgi:2,3-dihydroxy-p-cumate/2,3-dihydroxybenzoate 3,4-dioxygenase|nr:VOC family protein [Stellaceae bacterium]